MTISSVATSVERPAVWRLGYPAPQPGTSVPFTPTAAAPATNGIRLTARAAILVAVCTAAALTASTLGATSWDGSGGDAGAVVPVVALVAMVLAIVRRCPDPAAEAVRPVGRSLAFGIVVAAVVLGVVTMALPDVREDLFGPAVSVATIGTFLGLWGLRSPALLRNVAILGLLTWAPIASAVHGVVRTTLELPSEMVYRRLAAMPLLGIADEPWRLHTALLHRGSLVVITTVVLGFAASRSRVSVRTVVDVAIVAFVALVAHHSILLGSPVDEYAPDDAAMLASHPLLEVGVGAAAVLVLAVRQWARARRVTPLPTAVTAAPAPDGRDPFIFGNGGATTPAVTTVVLLAAAIPLWMLAVVLAV